MKHKKGLFWVLFIVCTAAGLGGLTYWRATEKGITATSLEDIERSRGMAVVVEQPVRRDFVRYTFVDGEVRGSKRYYLRSRVGTVGAIAEEVTVDVGDTVQEGQLLVRFRKEDLLAQLEAQKAAYEEATKNYERYKNLFEKGVVSANVLDNRRTMREQAASALRTARTQLQYARVVAPGGGDTGEKSSLYVAERFVDPGEFKRVGDALLKLTDLAQVELQMKVPESTVSRLAPGQALGYRLAGTREWKEGKIVRIGPSSDSPNRFFNVFVRANNTHRNGRWMMRPGMFVEGRIAKKKVSAGLAVRGSSVDWVGERQYLYVVKKTERTRDSADARDGVGASGKRGEQKQSRTVYVARRREIDTGLRSKGYVQILGDTIKKTDRIVCNPRVDLEDGVRVWIKEESCQKDESDAGGN